MNKIPSIAVSTSRFSAVMRAIWICLIAAVAVFGAMSPVHALIFEDGFESGDLSAWSGSNTEPGDTIAVSTEQVKSGTYSSKSVVDNDGAANQAMVWINFTGETTVYARMYIYVPSSFSTTDHVTIMQFLNDWSNIISTTIDDDMTLYMWNAVASEGYGVGVGSTLSKDEWHCLEMMAVISPTVGEARLWLDGNLEIEETGKNLGSNTIDKFAAGYYWANPYNESNTLYIDDAAVDTSPIGLLGNDTWWSSNYLYREQITITNNWGATVHGEGTYSGTIVGFTFDTASLISSGKLRSDGKDWRMVYDNGGTETEIARKIEGGWNTSSTETWFRLQADIADGDYDSNYYIYYGYAYEPTDPSILSTPNEIVYQQLSGTSQTAIATDWNNFQEWGAAQGIKAKRNNDSSSKITNFEFYCNARGSSSSEELTPFIFDGTNQFEDDEIPNGRGNNFVNSTVTVGWNDVTFNSPYPKVKNLAVNYAAILPTGNRDASSNYFRWDYANNDNDVQGYQVDKSSSSWGTWDFTNPGQDDFQIRVYGYEASINDVTASPRGETVQSTNMCNNWWDDTYLKRKKITITAGTAQIPSGYSVSVTIDHTAMVSEGSAQADGDDIRVAYWNGTTWTELDRVADPLLSWNNVSTKIWFKSQAVIDASSSDDNYYIYYDEPSASSPPDDWADVFMVGDDFNDGTLTSGVATSTAGTASIDETGGEAFIDLGTNESADAGIITTANSLPSNNRFAIRHKTKLISGGGASNPEFKGIGIQESAGQATVDTSANENPRRRIVSFLRVDTNAQIYYFDGPGSTNYWDGAAWQTGNGFWGTLSLDTYYIHELISDGTDWYVCIRDANGTVITKTTPVAWASTYDTGNPFWFYWGEIYTDFYYTDVKSDWFYVRQYVDSEPTTSVSGQECYQNYCYRRWITVDGDEVGGSSGYLDDFPVLVELSGDWLAAAPSGRIEHPSGYDIVFRGLDNTTCDGTAPCDLDHEIEKYTPGPDIRTSTGTFKTPGSTGTFSVEGLGFQPKALLLWGTAVTDESVAVHSAQWIGFADDTTQKVVAVTGEDGTANNPDTYRSAPEDANAVLYILNADGGATPPSPVAQATVSSYDSDGFTLNYSIASSGYIVHYVAYGGDDLQAFVGQSAADAGSVNTVPFRPELVFAATSCNTTAQTNTYGNQSFGVFNDDLNQWWVGSYQGTELEDSEDEKDSVLYTDGFLGQMYQGNKTWSLAVTSITATGFGWSGTNTDIFHYLALNLSGVGTFVGNFTKETSGTDPVSQDLPDFGFTPQFYMLASASETDLIANTPNSSRVTLGAYDGRTQHSTTRTDEVNPGTNQNADQRSSTSAVLGISALDATYDALASAQPISDSTPTIEWSPNDDNPYIIGVIGIEKPQGELLAWVRVPKLSATDSDPDNDTIIHMYYGNSCVDTDPQNATGVWDTANGWQGVWHLKEDPDSDGGTNEIKDSTSNANDGNSDCTDFPNNLPTQVAGKIDGSLNSDSTQERHVLVGDHTSLQLNSAMTISAWVQTTDTVASYFGAILNKWGAIAADQNYWLGKWSDGTTIQFHVDGSTEVVTAPLNLITSDGEFHHVVCVADTDSSPMKLRIYIDGNQEGSVDYDGTSQTGTGNLRTLNSPGANQEFNGTVDEVRIQSTSRSADWIATEYSNQDSPAIFYALGGEAPTGGYFAPTAPTTPYSNNTSAQSGQTNPNNIIDSSPAFSAIYNDPDSGDFANKYRVEVNTQSDFAGTVMWDSGAGGTSMVNTTEGNRCPDIIYAGTALASYMTYYWRITFWDDSGNQGTPSTTQNFTTGMISTSPVTLQVGGSYDDAHENDSEINFKPLEPNVSIIQYINGSSSKYNGGFRFAGVDIPPGSTINSATFSGYLYSATYDEMYATIYGHAADNSPDFTAPNDSIVDTGVRPRTTASVAWQETFGSTGWKDKDVTGIVQELIDRTGWSNNNALTLLFISDNNVMNKPCYFRSYDGVPAEAAKLTIDFTPPCLYTYKRAITIDGDEVGGSSGYLTDFPMLVNLSDTWLKTAPAGDIQNASGWDIIFRGLDNTTCNGTAPCDLDFEIETYDGSAGKLVAWVRVPRVYAGDNDPDNDSVIHMYYGSTCVDDDPQNATAVWDSNYKAVLHHAEKYGLDFDGADSYVDSGYNTHHTRTTIEAWIYPQGWGENSMGRVVDKREAGNQVFTLYLYGYSANHLRFERVHDGNTGSWRTNDDTIFLDTWQHIVVTYDESDPANDPSIYLNGQLQSLTEMETPSGTPLTNGDDYIIGNRGDGDRTFDGIIDELRIYNKILTSTEVSERYQGKKEPSKDGLVIEYLMDEGSGNTVSDSSGNDRGGDMTGHAAAWIRPRAHDSTSNSNFGKRSVSMAAPEERINGCDPFNSEGVGIPDPGGSWEFADGGLDAGTSDFTISAWFLHSAAMTEDDPTIVTKGGGSAASTGYWFQYRKSEDEIYLRVADGVKRFSANSNNAPLGVTADEWHYVTAVFDREPGLDTAYFYLNGDPVGTESWPDIAGNSVSGTNDVWIGSNNLIGNLDEVRISSQVRAADWIKTEFNNQTSPSTFYGLGGAGPVTGYFAPTAPTVPYSNDTSAQSGQTNPSDITDPTPAFSAIFNDPDSGDIASKYRVEVNTASDFSGTVMWDSGAGGMSMANTTEGNRCPDIIYAGSNLASSTTYYWRITFWDDDGFEGAASATQNFTTGTIATTTLSWGENSSRDDFNAVTQDTYLDEGQPSYDMGTNGLIRIGDDGGRINRTLIKYDLSGLDGLISSSGQIVSATLKIKTYDDPDPGDIDVDAFRLKKDWFEGTKSYAIADDGDDAATWQYQVYDETAWTGAGADDSTDRETTSDDVDTFSANNTWYSWDVTDSVKYFFDNPASNFGWLLKAQSEGTTKYWRVYSSEAANADNRPYLEITVNDDPACSYAYKRAITIDHNDVIGDSGDTVDLIDFPILIKESGNWLRNSTYTDGHIENSNGYDIIFKDATETLTLAHEIEYYKGTDAGGNVTLSDGWHTGTGAYTVPAGSERLLVFVTGFEEATDNQTTITNVTYGGVSMTQAVEHFTYSSPLTLRTGIWYLKESQIPSGSNSFVVTYSPSDPGRNLHAYALFTNVNQLNSFVDADSGTVASSTTVTTDNPFNVVAGGMAVSAVVSNVPGSYDNNLWGTGWTEGTDQASGYHSVGTANSGLYGSDTTDSGTATFDQAARHVIVAASMRPSSTGNLVGWVKIPTLDADADTVIYMYYGNSCITAETQNKSAVWNTNYKGVWHMPEEAAGTGTAALYQDSTSNANHGDDNVDATAQTGQIDGGQQFDGVDDHALLPDPGGSFEFSEGGLDGGTSDFSISAWVNLDASVSDSFPTILKKGGGDDTSGGYWFNYYKTDDTLDLRELMFNIYRQGNEILLGLVK